MEFLEVLHLPSTTGAQVIQRLKATFAKLGIPGVVASDNGNQFSCAEFQELARHTSKILHLVLNIVRETDMQREQYRQLRKSSSWKIH